MVDYRRLERDIPEIAAHVEQVSELRVPLDTLKFEIVKYSLNGSVMSYSHSERKARVFQDMIPPKYSQNEINTILGHELTHHAQYSVESFEKMVQTVERIKEGEESDEDRIRNICLSRFIEGDAYWVGDKLHQFYSRDILTTLYSFKNRMLLKYAGVLFPLMAETLIDYYGMGGRRISTLIAEGGREAVNRLYRVGIEEIVNHFSNEVVERSITSGEKNFKAALAKVASIISS